MKIRRDRETIAVILSTGMVTALNLVVLGAMVRIIRNPDAVLSENVTQILTGWGGGILGILGAVFGYRAGAAQTGDDPPAKPENKEQEKP